MRPYSCGPYRQRVLAPGRYQRCSEQGGFLRSTKGFICKRCGKCCGMIDAICISLDPRDIRRWKKEERFDILRHTVKLSPRIYDGWFSVKTGDELSRCPWYRKSDGQARCRIHNTKPTLCQIYPLTKRHALLSGCKGYTIKGSSAKLSVRCPACKTIYSVGKNYLMKPNIKCSCGTTGAIEFEEDLWEIGRQISIGRENDKTIKKIGRPQIIDSCHVMLEDGHYEASVFIQWCRGDI